MEEGFAAVGGVGGEVVELAVEEEGVGVCRERERERG